MCGINITYLNPYSVRVNNFETVIYNLIKINHRRVVTYQRAASKLSKADGKGVGHMFTRMAKESELNSKDLLKILQQFSDDIEVREFIPGGEQGHDNLSTLLRKCLTQEDVTCKAYEDAIRSTLPGEALAVIKAQNQSLLLSHERIRRYYELAKEDSRE